MIDIRKLKELVRLMVTNELTELDLRDSEEQVTLRRHSVVNAPQVTVPSPVSAPATPATAAPAAAESQPEPEDGFIKIESPIVGTFYAAGNPDSPAFVSTGSNVDPETVVCIVEAMKIFNEIKAECSGTIHKIMVKNGDPVEFGQPLFLVKPG